MSRRAVTVGELAAYLGGRLTDALGRAADPEIVIRRLSPPDRAGPDAVAVVSAARHLAVLSADAGAVITSSAVAARPSRFGGPFILVDDPYLAFARTAQRLHPPPPRPPPGVHPQAFVDPSAFLGAGVAVGPMAYVGRRARLEDHAVLYPGAHVEEDSAIGAGTVLYNNVTVRHGCRIGARCIVHPGVVIGADGFGYARTVDGPTKIPHVGGVMIEDDVEIGANTTIDRGTFEDTRVGRGAKLDNLVQVGHNVVIGPGCILVAQCGVAGSSRIESGAVLGAQSGVSGHLTVGRGATVYGQAGVMRDVGPGEQVAGAPAQPRTSFFRAVLRVRKLDGWAERVRQLERAVRGLTRRND